MGRVYSDTERLLQGAELSRRGHHNQAANLYQKMGNEVRNPKEKRKLWEMAEYSRKSGASD